MRVYLPASLTDLRTLLDDTALAAPRAGFAVTPALAAWAAADGPVDDEQAELVAASEAARASLRLVDPAAARRVVLAVDVPTRAVTVEDAAADVGPGHVLVTTSLGAEEVAAVLVDDASAAADVRAAAAVVGAADEGEAAAEASVAVLDQHDLLWYDASELTAVLDG